MVAAFAVGNVLAGKYEITRKIGDGGLGIVVAARHLQLDQEVAIKHLKPIALTRPIAVERFLREARLAAQVRSEHVTRIYDVGTTELGCPYIVMERLEGSDLGDLLAAISRVPPPRAIDYVLQACEALAEAHVRGIVHRDLKPENLFLARRPGGATTLKVLDFGISKLSEKSESAGPRQSKLTGDRETFGTPNYMSPEQLQSASDVDEPEMPQLCLSIVDKDAPPLPATVDVPEGLRAIIAKCLAKNRTERFANVGELASELAPFAPSASLPRIHHVRQIVAEGGGTVPAMPAHEHLVSRTASSPQALSAPGVSIASDGLPRRKPTAAGLVGLASIGVLVGFCVVLALMASRPRAPSAAASSAPSPSGLPASASPSPSATELGEPAPAAVPGAADTKDQTKPKTPNEPAPSATVSPETRGSRAPAAVLSPAVRPAAAPARVRPAAAPTVDPTAKKHAEFGERQ
jgi:serine/threonine-protein kinase